MEKDFLYLDSLIRKLSQQQIMALAFLLTLGMAVIQYLVASQLTLSALFLFPIALSTWYLGRKYGIACCVLSGISCFWHDIVWSEGSIVPALNALNQLVIFSVASFGISFVQRHLQQERALSRTDELTGVMTTDAFSEASQQLFSLAGRNGTNTILAHVDIDNLQQMNERFGNSVGDKALQEMSQLFRGSMRKTDVIGRNNGGFVILLPETSATGARSKLGKLKNELAHRAHEHKWPIGFSIGAVSFEHPPRDVRHAMQATEQLMGKIKRNGKNSMVFEHYVVSENSSIH